MADPLSPAFRGVVQRRSSTLIYGHDRDRDVAAHRRLMATLSVWEEDITGAKWKTFEATLVDTDPLGRKILRLPGWVDVEAVAAAWPSHVWTEAFRPWPARDVTVRFHGQQYPFKNKDQSRIVDYLLGQGSFERMVDASAYLVVADTAAGKSYCSIRAWTIYGDVLLGLFAQLTHLENYKVELLKFTDLTEDDILVVDDGRDTLRRARKRGLATYKAILVLHKTAWRCHAAALDHEAGRLTSPNELVEVIKEAGVGTVVADECHLEFKSLVVLAMMTNVRRWVFLTATPKRTEWQEDRIFKQVVPFDSALRIRAIPRLAVTQIRFDSRPSEADVIASVNRRGYFDVPGYFDYLSRSSKYDRWEEMVTALVARAFDAGATGVGVVVGGKLEFLDRVCNSMRDAFPDRSIGNFSSRIKKREDKMLELERDIIVTTEKSFGGSVNPPRMSHMILAAPLASDVWVKQITGRLRGLNGAPCELLDVWDAGFPNIREQTRRRKTTYKKFALSITDEEYEP